MAPRTPKPNYALKGDVECEFYAPSDAAALSKAQGIMCGRQVRSECFTKLYLLGPVVDELLFGLQRSPGVLCTTVQL